MSKPTIAEGAGKPLLPCDIVMAGGVTSGVIYPGAVAVIARRFAFHSIGGTSVGAIAAAATAAAEYGRRTGAADRPFERLAELPRQLGETCDGRSRLFHLFTPEPTTAPLFHFLTAATTGQRRLTRSAASLLHDWRVLAAVVVAAVLSLLPILHLLADGRIVPALAAVLPLLGAMAAGYCAAAIGVMTRVWLPAWSANNYGTCRGLAQPAVQPGAGVAAFHGLTPWVHGVVQQVAGRGVDGTPLTFGDLWSAPGPDGSPASDDTARSIELAMIASDISRNRTVQLPFIEAPSPLYADLRELAHYFPKEIVAWMRDRPGDYEPDVERRDQVIRLPHPTDLPIVFAARLSLSFPILLSAVPLLAPDYARRRADGKVPLRKVWFSDGGLTSNFPIHFFDSPIPSRPTFCLNLIDYDAEAPETKTSDAVAGALGPDGEDTGAPAPVDVDAPDGADHKPIGCTQAPERRADRRRDPTWGVDPQPGDDVWGFVAMSKGNRFAPVPFTAFDKVPGPGLRAFLQSLLNTARFWSDNQLLVAPGVRDRVVHIALRNDEGGINLDMDARMIADLDLRGRAAGMLLVSRFDPTAKADPATGGAVSHSFARHRWVRYRSFMAAFEDLTRRFVRSRRNSNLAAVTRGEPDLDAMLLPSGAQHLGYPVTRVALDHFRATTSELEALAGSMAGRTKNDSAATFDPPRIPGAPPPQGSAPRPKMRLRLRPLVDNDPEAETEKLPDESGSS